MFRLPGALGVTAAVAVLAAACGFVGQEQTLEDCLRDGGQGFEDALPPDLAQSIPEEKLARAIRPLCEELVRTPGSESLDDEAVPPLMSRVFRENPHLWEPICHLVVDADFAANAADIRYVTPRERETFRSETCRLSTDYMRVDSPAIDYGRFVTEHPDLYAPFCAAGIQLSFEADPWARDFFSAREKRSIARQSCLEALKTGVIDASGPEGIRNPRVDEAAFCALVGRVTSRVIGGNADDLTASDCAHPA
jgi:hypothetical protein